MVERIFFDPAPGLYPKCRCDSRCDMPCWQRDGIDPDFDPNDPRSCCCFNRSAPEKDGGGDG